MLKPFALALLAAGSALAAPLLGTAQDPLGSSFCQKYGCKLTAREDRLGRYALAHGAELVLVSDQGGVLRTADLGISAGSLAELRASEALVRDYLAAFPSQTRLGDCWTALDRMRGRETSTPLGKTRLVREKNCRVAYAPTQRPKAYLLMVYSR